MVNNLSSWRAISFTLRQRAPGVALKTTRFETNLGLKERISDLIQRFFGLFFSYIKTESSLDKFHGIPKIWSGKRIKWITTFVTEAEGNAKQNALMTSSQNISSFASGKNIEDTVDNQASNSEFPFPDTEELINNFGSYWSDEDKMFYPIPFNNKKFNALVEFNNQRYSKDVADNQNYGFIEKKDVPEGTQIFVRADLHGDLKSLIENIKTLKDQGLLDEHFKCRPNVQLVFLGDYGDRGNNSMEVFQLLMTLRLQNPEQVTLIRGNHEDLLINTYYCGGDNNFTDYLNGPNAADNCALLNAFYATLPLTVYMSQQNGMDERQYVQFTHGMFELHVDPQAMLESDKDYERLDVPRERKFSERVRKLSQKNELNDLSQNTDNLTHSDKTERRIRKQRIAAKKIEQLMDSDLKNNRERDYTTYNWGDVKRGGSSCMGDPGERHWKLVPEDIKYYLQLSSLHHPVKLLFRGHEHELQNHCAQNGKLVVTTMPIGMDLGAYTDRFQNQYDTVFILKTAPKVKDWTKQSYLRIRGQPTKEITEQVPIRDVKIKLIND